MKARDLLYKYLNYKCSWSVSPNCHPARLRREQIDTLLVTFGLIKNYGDIFYFKKYFNKTNRDKRKRIKSMTNLEYFECGEFIDEWNFENYKEVLNRIEYIPDSDPLKNKLMNNISINSRIIFQELMHFRLGVYNICQRNMGFDEGFEVGVFYGQIKCEELKILIRENTTAIDDVICSLIDPYGREFSKKELEMRYNYKEYDFDQIDLQYRVEQYY